MRKKLSVILLCVLALMMTSCNSKSQVENKKETTVNAETTAKPKETSTSEETSIPKETSTQEAEGELTCHVGGPICKLCGEYYRGEYLTEVGSQGYDFEIYENGMVITTINSWQNPIPESYEYHEKSYPLIEIEYLTASDYNMKDITNAIKTNEAINGGVLNLPPTVVKLGNINLEEFPFKELVIPNHIQYVCGEVSVCGTKEPSQLERIVFPEGVRFEQYDGEELVDSLSGFSFTNSKNLKEFEVPSICQSIRLKNCAIENLVVPENIVTMEVDTCWNLRTITYEPYAGTQERRIILRNLNLDKHYIPEGIRQEREKSSRAKNVYFKELEFSEKMDLSKLVYFFYFEDIDFEKEVANMPAGLVTTEELSGYYPTEYYIDNFILPYGLKVIDLEFQTGTNEEVTVNRFILPDTLESCNVDFDYKGIAGSIKYMQFPPCFSVGDGVKKNYLESLNEDCVYGVPAEKLEEFKANYPEYNFVEANYIYE